MKAMLINRIAPLTENPEPLTAAVLPVSEPATDEILIRVTACGVCHTELDEIEGRTPPYVFTRSHKMFELHSCHPRSAKVLAIGDEPTALHGTGN